MTLKISYHVFCDACACGDSGGWSEEAARAESLRYGWVRVRDSRGELVDLCPDCAARFGEWSGAPRIEVRGGVQP